MNFDLASLDGNGATRLTRELLAQWDDANRAVDREQRRAIGIRKMIDGLVEMFPAVEDILPEDLDDEDEPRPRGSAAVQRVLAESPSDWFTVPSVVSLLDRRGWAPNSSNPANAVRSALERLVETGGVEKIRSTAGQVIYRHPGGANDQANPFAPVEEEPF